MQSEADHGKAAAVCMGVRVPPSPFLHEKRIARLNAAQYEGQEIAGALAVVQAGDRVLELGAGLGVVGAVIAHNRAPDEVRAFEANAELIPHIRALYAENRLDDRIGVENAVLMAGAEIPDEVSFFLRTSFLGSSLTDAPGRRTREVRVRTRRFDAVLADFRPDVLVIDIEGGELELLRHSGLAGVRAVVIEFHPDAYGPEGMREAKRLLRDAGFLRDDTLSTRTVWTCRRDGAAEAAA